MSVSRVTVRAMTTLVVLAWMLALFPVVIYAMAVIAVGGLALKSARWDYAFQWMGVHELQRRNIGAIRSQRTALILEAIVGNRDEPEDNDSGDDPLFTIVSALIGAPDKAEISNELCRRRREILVGCLIRQRRVAARVRRVRRLPIAWNALRALASAEGWGRGLIWTLPPAIQHLTRLLSKPFAISQVVALFLGAVYWTIVASGGEDPLSVISWFTGLVWS